MTWTKLGDNYADRLEDLGLTPTACWLHTAALVYCNRVGNDGRLPASKLGKVASIAAPDLYVAELEQQGLWVPIEGEDAWQVDWTDQEPAEDVKRRRDGATQRQRKRRQHLGGDHSLCDEGRSCAHVTRDGDDERALRTVNTPVTRDSQRESRRESRSPVPSRPTRPGPKEPGKGGSSGQPGDVTVARTDDECGHCTETRSRCEATQQLVAPSERHLFVPKVARVQHDESRAVS